MQDQSRGQILVTGVDDPVYNAVVNVLSPLGFDIHRAPWDDYLRDHVQITPFDVIIVGLQPSGDGLDQFFKSTRARGSACHHAGVVLRRAVESGVGNLDTVEVRLHEIE